MDSVIETVQSIESDYGMNSRKWSNSDSRLKKLHKWWLDHPDTREVAIYKIYRDGIYLMTGTATEIANRIGYDNPGSVYAFNSKAYKHKKHVVNYELLEVEK